VLTGIISPISAVISLPVTGTIALPVTSSLPVIALIF
jgi:hypothetical protein